MRACTGSIMIANLTEKHIEMYHLNVMIAYKHVHIITSISYWYRYHAMLQSNMAFSTRNCSHICLDTLLRFVNRSLHANYTFLFKTLPLKELGLTIQSTNNAVRTREAWMNLYESLSVFGCIFLDIICLHLYPRSDL